MSFSSERKILNEESVLPWEPQSPEIDTMSPKFLITPLETANLKNTILIWEIAELVQSYALGFKANILNFFWIVTYLVEVWRPYKRFDLKPLGIRNFAGPEENMKMCIIVLLEILHYEAFGSILKWCNLEFKRIDGLMWYYFYLLLILAKQEVYETLKVKKTFKSKKLIFGSRRIEWYWKSIIW